MGKERRTSLVQEKVYNHSENGGKVYDKLSKDTWNCVLLGPSSFNISLSSHSSFHHPDKDFVCSQHEIGGVPTLQGGALEAGGGGGCHEGQRQLP